MPGILNHAAICYHCGENCSNDQIKLESKLFCCEGCKMVYQLLNESDLCNYYDLNSSPGQNLQVTIRKDKFAFLEDTAIEQELIQFKDDTQTQLSFYLPQIHCSSCLYLLEHLTKLNAGIIRSTVQFTRKEVEIQFDHRVISLRKVAELLSEIGYEPYISLQQLNRKKPALPKTMIYQLGVAGFCFANIMLMSFPEYLGLESNEPILQAGFRYFNMILSLPVLLFCAQPFYLSAWSSLKHNYLNIDAPIVLAILVTFVRSIIEVLTQTGSGYFDSFAGIVFFMLAGRVLQDKTYQQLSFERDYTSYFPIAVTVLKDQLPIPTALPNLKPGDTLVIHQEELIPADGILTRGTACIDYSFVTGESTPVMKEMGEIIYAGGKQTGGTIELLTIKEVAQSYLTRLWNKSDNEIEKTSTSSFVDLISRYFTYIVFFIALITAGWWWFQDASRIWPSVTAILIIACPCALLLSNTFTNGNILRIFSKNGFYLRNAQTIEKIAAIDHIVFDKTGTLTTTNKHTVVYEGNKLSKEERNAISALASNSRHPLSKALVQELGCNWFSVEQYREHIGKGLEGKINGNFYKIGSQNFVTGTKDIRGGSKVFVSIDGKLKGHFGFRQYYRQQIDELLNQLQNQYEIAVLSGDNDAEKTALQKITTHRSDLQFYQQPADKLKYIQQLQQQEKNVMMIGDGLNDAIALKQSNVGIAIAEQSNTFTPASDGILDANSLIKLNKFLKLAKVNKTIVVASFIMSITYNMIGLYFAVQGQLSPMIAAILMPTSSLSIILLTYGASGMIARRWKL